jgi:hypothetical protein
MLAMHVPLRSSTGAVLQHHVTAAADGDALQPAVGRCVALQYCLLTCCPVALMSHNVTRRVSVIITQHCAMHSQRWVL